MKMQSSFTKYKVYPLVMNINVKRTSYKRTHQNIFKKLNSWATGTVKCGCSSNNFLKTQSCISHLECFLYLAKCFLKKENNMFKWEGCNACCFDH